MFGFVFFKLTDSSHNCLYLESLSCAAVLKPHTPKKKKGVLLFLRKVQHFRFTFLRRNAIYFFS